MAAPTAAYPSAPIAFPCSTSLRSGSSGVPSGAASNCATSCAPIEVMPVFERSRVSSGAVVFWSTETSLPMPSSYKQLFETESETHLAASPRNCFSSRSTSSATMPAVVRSSSRNPCHSSPQLPGGFHTLTILSMPLEKSVPSGVRHRLATVSRWPCIVPRHVPSFQSHTLMMLSTAHE